MKYKWSSLETSNCESMIRLILHLTYLLLFQVFWFLCYEPSSYCTMVVQLWVWSSVGVSTTVFFSVWNWTLPWCLHLCWRKAKVGRHDCFDSELYALSLCRWLCWKVPKPRQRQWMHFAVVLQLWKPFTKPRKPIPQFPFLNSNHVPVCVFVVFCWLLEEDNIMLDVDSNIM
jgi:hypothetical protein